MSRRIRRTAVAAVALVVIVIGGGFAVFALRGSDAPPPPSLSARQAPADASTTPQAGATTWEVVPGEQTFAGYRVREEFVTVGVVDAVGRTGDVSGTVRIDGDRLRSARLETDMTTLRSDESRRDGALRERGIETDRYPTSEFRLTEPVELSRDGAQARGELMLHGRTQPVTATVRGQRAGDDAIELVGSASIDFERFGIEPPSVAGFVTVQDTGKLEFQLRLRPR